MRTLLTATLIGIGICACTTNQNRSDSQADISPQMIEYSNEFFSLKYPSNWEYDEEINNINDTIPAMSKGIRTTLYSSNPYSSYHTVMVQKSAMFECFKTPEEWRNLSVELKQFDKQYIGTVDSYMLDSLYFGPYPAAMAGFVIALESGDTLIHKQMVVMVDKDLYYLNNTFNWRDDGQFEQLGDSILSTIRFNIVSE